MYVSCFAILEDFIRDFFYAGIGVGLMCEGYFFFFFWLIKEISGKILAYLSSDNQSTLIVQYTQMIY